MRKNLMTEERKYALLLAEPHVSLDAEHLRPFGR